MHSKDIFNRISDTLEKLKKFHIENSIEIQSYINNTFFTNSLSIQYNFIELYQELIHILEQEIYNIKILHPKIKDFYDYYVKTDSEERKVNLINRKYIKTLQNNEFFGEIGLDGLRKRTASIKASNSITNPEDVVLACIDSYAYNEYMSYESQNISLRNCKILVENFFFKGIPHLIFLHKYFPCFIQQVYNKYEFSGRTNFLFAFYIMSIRHKNHYLCIVYIYLNALTQLT